MRRFFYGMLLFLSCSAFAASEASDEYRNVIQYHPERLLPYFESDKYYDQAEVDGIVQNVVYYYYDNEYAFTVVVNAGTHQTYDYVENTRIAAIQGQYYLRRDLVTNPDTTFRDIDEFNSAFHKNGEFYELELPEGEAHYSSSQIHKISESTRCGDLYQIEIEGLYHRHPYHFTKKSLPLFKHLSSIIAQAEAQRPRRKIAFNLTSLQEVEEMPARKIKSMTKNEFSQIIWVSDQIDDESEQKAKDIEERREHKRRQFRKKSRVVPEGEAPAETLGPKSKVKAVSVANQADDRTPLARVVPPNVNPEFTQSQEEPQKVVYE